MAVSRRELFTTLPALGALSVTRISAAGKGQLLAANRVRFADGATELEVQRLTDPSSASFLPAPWMRPSSSRGGFLICASDRTGTMQALRLDLRTGESRVLTEAAQLDRASLTLAADEKSIFYFDGSALKATSLASLRERTVAEAESPSALTVSDDSLQAAFLSGGRLMVANIARSGSEPIAEAPDANRVLLRPKRAAVLYRRGDALWLASLDKQENRKLKTAPVTGTAQWSPDGRTVLYLSGLELREHTPDSNTDALIAKTSQFGDFGRNADGSVFVGASSSKAGPYVLLLLRISRRELALCEHRCSDPAQVHPSFAPSSQRIYFQSDRHGKMAIYSMVVDKLVERTDT
ncbi:MAG: hypothetical protein SFV18_01465 [Bryobacteraceae bacterium]|nr:hypothetical protein [Bryobacteraceae bacterium]